MWNTSLLLPGVLLAPLTLLAGPQITLHRGAHAGLRRVGGQPVPGAAPVGGQLVAAALGGAVYGFSPALLNSGIGHYHLQFAVLPPLIIDALLRLVTGRGRWSGPAPGSACSPPPSCSPGKNCSTDTALAAVVLTVALVTSGHRHERSAR